MASIRQIRTRIKSVKNIQQITRAMKMVASARLHKAQRQLLESRPYAFKTREAICEISAHAPHLDHPLLRKNPASTSCVVVMTSDKGLCGGFNAPPLQTAARRVIGVSAPEKVEVIGVGRKGMDFFRRAGIDVVKKYAGFWQDLNWYHADSIGQDLIDAYVSGRWSQLTLVYNRFKSAISQELVEEVLLPLPRQASCVANEPKYAEFEFEPSAEAIFHHLLPRYIKVSLWHALLESKAAELAARMQSMGNATQSAGDMISDLTLHMNRARQAAITREISELVGSAEAINA